MTAIPARLRLPLNKLDQARFHLVLLAVSACRWGDLLK